MDEVTGSLERIELRARGIDEDAAAELRAQLSTFAEDWDSPEMDVYDDYDAAKARLDARRDCNSE